MTLLTWTSCHQERETEAVGSMKEEKGISCIITSPAGDLFSSYARLDIPPFFNVGELQIKDTKTEVLVLSSRMAKGKRLRVDVIGLFSFKHGEENKYYVITIPRDQSLNNLERSYDEFLIHNMEIRSGIESWFRAQCPLGDCHSFKWENAFKALLKIEQ